METTKAVKALGALAQETRLDVFRRLIVAGPSGLAAGAIASLTGTPGPTLTFHLKELESAGLVERKRAGRNIFYRANFAAISALVDFLAEDCCKADPGAGEALSCAPCAPAKAKARTKKARA